MNTATPLISAEKTEARLLHFLSDRDDSLTVVNLLLAVLRQI